MKNSLNVIFGVTVLSLALLSGCQEGPAEKQGKKIDETVQNIKDTEQNKGPMQKAGEKVDETTGQTPVQ